MALKMVEGGLGQRALLHRDLLLGDNFGPIYTHFINSEPLPVTVGKTKRTTKEVFRITNITKNGANSRQCSYAGIVTADRGHLILGLKFFSHLWSARW